MIQEAETGALTQSYTYDARGNRASMTVSGKERYTVSYAYDANNRLLTERKTRGLLTDLTTYAYDANGNLLSKTFNGGDGSLTGAAYTYNLFNQLSTAAENGLIAAYAYNAQGIRTCKATATSQTHFLLDGGNVVGEHIGSKTVTYLRGANLISRSDGSKKTYYLFNAHGDVTELVSDSSTVTHKYDYDAFGVEKKPDPLDGNPFRYCGEYYDGETKTYYLRARYYDPNIGRFTQQDTHWTTANSIYGDNPQKINEREDKLGLKSYSYAPQITAVMQSGNLYVYGVGNPVLYADANGAWIHILIGAGIGLVGGALINLASQLMTGEWKDLDLVELGISALGGAIGGGLTATGFGAVAAAITSAGTDLAIQLHDIRMDFSQIDVVSILYSAALGAIGAKVGGCAGNTKHLDSMSSACIKRIGSALSGKTVTSSAALKSAGMEIMKTLKYYSSQMSNDIFKVIGSIIRSYLPWVFDLGIDFAFMQWYE